MTTGANIPLVLIGFMGTGKTTIGRRLAESLGRSFYDLDDEIEVSAGKSISKIFDESGETAFREIEGAILASVLAVKPPGVIAAGGGAVIRRSNRDLLRDQAVTIFIDPPFDKIWERLEHDRAHRPLAACRPRDELEHLHAARCEIYRECAAMTVPVPGTPEQIVETILFRLESLKKWNLAGLHADEREILEIRRAKR